MRMLAYLLAIICIIAAVMVLFIGRTAPVPAAVPA